MPIEALCKGYPCECQQPLPGTLARSSGPGLQASWGEAGKCGLLGLPAEFATCLSFCCSLRFEDKPDY